jgi:hypothetical protein
MEEDFSSTTIKLQNISRLTPIRIFYVARIAIARTIIYDPVALSLPWTPTTNISSACVLSSSSLYRDITTTKRSTTSFSTINRTGVSQNAVHATRPANLEKGATPTTVCVCFVLFLPSGHAVDGISVILGHTCQGATQQDFRWFIPGYSLVFAGSNI